MRRPYEPPLLTAAKWTGSLAGIAGSVMIALNIGMTGYGFILFLISSLLWTSAAVAQRETSLTVLQGAFTVINVLGIVRWMGV